MGLNTWLNQVGHLRWTWPGGIGDCSNSSAAAAGHQKQPGASKAASNIRKQLQQQQIIFSTHLLPFLFCSTIGGDWTIFGSTHQPCMEKEAKHKYKDNFYIQHCLCRWCCLIDSGQIHGIQTIICLLQSTLCRVVKAVEVCEVFNGEVCPSVVDTLCTHARRVASMCSVYKDFTNRTLHHCFFTSDTCYCSTQE